MSFFHLFSHFNLNFYKYLPNLFNFVVFFKVVITWCAASSLMPSHLSFKTCSLLLLVSAHFSVIRVCTLFPSLNRENLPFLARFLRYLGFQTPSWKQANQFLFYSNYIGLYTVPSSDFSSSAVHKISNK